MIITSTNIDYLITPTRFHIGDVSSTLFTDSIIMTGLVFGVKMLQTRWNNRYMVYTSGMLVSGTTVNTPVGQYDLGYLPSENDVFRNPSLSFASIPPPIIDQNDDPVIVLAASILIRRSAISSSASAFSNWSTPDLSVSNVQSGKMLLDMLKTDEQALNDMFKSRLAKPLKSTFPLGAAQDLTPFIDLTSTIPTVAIVRDTEQR